MNITNISSEANVDLTVESYRGALFRLLCAHSSLCCEDVWSDYEVVWWCVYCKPVHVLSHHIFHCVLLRHYSIMGWFVWWWSYLKIQNRVRKLASGHAWYRKTTNCCDFIPLATRPIITLVWKVWYGSWHQERQLWKYQIQLILRRRIRSSIGCKHISLCPWQWCF